MRSKNLFLLFIAVWASLSAQAQFAEPVHFTTSTRQVSPTRLEVTFKGTIDAGWHVYSTDLEGGPTPATFTLEEHEGVALDGKLKAGAGEKQTFDPIFNMPVRYFEGAATFTQNLKITQPKYKVKGFLEYGACNDQNCLPPTQVEFATTGESPQLEAKAADTPDRDQPAASANTPQPEETPAADTLNSQLSTLHSQLDSLWWQPSVETLKACGDTAPASRGLLMVFLLGLLGGLIALVTPCVWPVIPMTVSFFLHRSEDRRRALREAILYGLSIVVIYVGLGLLISLLWPTGANGLNALGTNAIFNLFICLLLVVFAASFLGGFELTLPSSWNNKANAKADTTSGVVSIFFMALTLVLVSFSCTGPIIGFLLAGLSTMGEVLTAVVGMLGFAIALALPFMLFALFPSWMKKLPKSGGWMNTVKVVLGFIELAFALKFFSVADLAYGWHLLDREVFLSLWIVIFALLGCYLLGWLRLPGDAPSDHTSVPRFFLALISLAFAVYMMPGLWGAPLKAISAFSPPLYTQDFRLDRQSVESEFRDYEAGMSHALGQKKPVLLDFTGYGCVNCRKMEQAVWNDSRVQSVLKDKYVLVSLYVDDKTPLPERMTVTENGRERTLRTVGDKWSYLQRMKFGAQTQPFYVLVDNNGQPLNRSYGYDESVPRFLKFLQEGLERFGNE